MREASYVIRYEHRNCKVDPGIAWCDSWSCACNGKCPACGMKDIEPVAWREASDFFDRPVGDPRGERR